MLATWYEMATFSTPSTPYLQSRTLCLRDVQTAQSPLGTALTGLTGPAELLGTHLVALLSGPHPLEPRHLCPVNLLLTR
ncbi:hypothetical protein IF1G_07361 [Cordyceps javanica]|uniref:Uncharacterized protein n=1 Tax=Cordyceps javanica TaxID=43265 RepID=A0A545UVZ2_9HYPO|nr:hypothetical protein IF1G_07361 [Cordyceps javanica]